MSHLTDVFTQRGKVFKSFITPQVNLHGVELTFFQEFFQGAKSIVMQISFVMLIFLLFSDQILGGEVSEGENCLPAPCGRKPVECGRR